MPIKQKEQPQEKPQEAQQYEQVQQHEQEQLQQEEEELKQQQQQHDQQLNKGEKPNESDNAGAPSNAEKEHTSCIATGPCVKCHDEEQDQVYCSHTGYRIEVTCTVTDSTTNKQDKVFYRSCHEEDVTGIYIYEGLAFGLFILSCYAVRSRRAKLVQKQAERIAKQVGSTA